MRARFDEIRDRYRVCAEDHKNPLLIALMVAEQVGLCDQNGQRHLREDGAPTLAEKPARSPADFHPELLAEAIIGPQWKSVLGLNNRDADFPFARLMREASRSGLIQEENAAPIGPSVWANVAAWSATVGGLMQAQFIDSYRQSPFDLADLAPVKPAIFWQGGERYIDILGPYKPASEVGPGEEYPDHGMSALWVEPGAMKKYAGKISVTKETAAIDISGGQLLARAKDAGQSLKFRENELYLDVLCGQTNNWKLGMLTDTAATAYNTYGPTITNPQGTSRTIPNDNVNPLNDVGALQKSNEYLAGLYHPVTDNPIDVMMDTAIFPTPLAMWADAINQVEAINLLTQTTAGPAQSPGGAGFPTAMLKANNPWKGTVRQAIASRWLHQRHTASVTQSDPNRTAGLGLAGAAVYRWYRLDRNWAVKRQMWPATSVDITPGDWVMATQGIIAALAFDIATQIQVVNPYGVQRNKAA